MNTDAAKTPTRLRVALRWTIGDVSPRGLEALDLLLWGAWKLFGARATYDGGQHHDAERGARVGAPPIP